MVLAPIIMFVFSRPEHTRKTLDALSQNTLAAQSDLTVFCDCPRNERDVAGVEAAKAVVRDCKGFNSVTLVERTSNLGSSHNMNLGVTETLAVHESVIVVEDDAVSSPYFLKYMNDALTLYKDHEKVGWVSGYCYPLAYEPMPETFFLKKLAPWAWGTWRRAWEPDLNPKDLYDRIGAQDRFYEFNVEGSHLCQWLLEQEIAGKIPACDAVWYANLFLNDQLALFPGRPLIRNIGFDGTGVNCKEHSKYEVELASSPITVEVQEPVEDPELRRQLARFFSRKTLKQRLAKVKNRLLGRPHI